MACRRIFVNYDKILCKQHYVNFRNRSEEWQAQAQIWWNARRFSHYICPPVPCRSPAEAQRCFPSQKRDLQKFQQISQSRPPFSRRVSHSRVNLGILLPLPGQGSGSAPRSAGPRGRLFPTLSAASTAEQSGSQSAGQRRSQQRDPPR